MHVIGNSQLPVCNAAFKSILARLEKRFLIHSIEIHNKDSLIWPTNNMILIGGIGIIFNKL